MPESENQIDHQDIELDLEDADVPVEINEQGTVEIRNADSVPAPLKDVPTHD